MNTLSISEKSFERYFGFLFRLDIKSKRTLIKMLEESIVKKRDTDDWTSLAGGWEDHRSSDEIITDIYESRTPSRPIENMD